MFPTQFDSRLVTIETAAAVIGVSAETVRACLAMEDFMPTGADWTLDFGTFRRLIDTYAPGAAAAQAAENHRREVAAARRRTPSCN